MSYPTSTIAPTTTTTLVIFDSQVADLPLLYTALLPGSIAHTIKPDQDPIDQITHLLTQTGATKLAIVAHGQPGSIQIGNGKIDRAMLETRSGLLQEWGVKEIALYSCEVGADDEFIRRLGKLTGAQIAATTDRVGAGNWELDGGVGLLEIDRLADYSSTLATFTGTSGNDEAEAYAYTLFTYPYLTGFAGGTVTELTDTTGDTFNGNNGNDYVNAYTGNDTIYGNAGNDSLYGNDGNDLIDGGDGSNLLYGGAGDDRIDANYMRDTVDGGIGNDFLYISTPTSTDSNTIEFTGENAGKFKINGTQTGTFTDIEQLLFFGDNGNDVLDASLANLSVTPAGTAAGYNKGLWFLGYGGNDTVFGSSGNDWIRGNDGDNILYGNGGDDRVIGGNGNNLLDGGDGDDFIVTNTRGTADGGSGNDLLSVTGDNTGTATVEFTSANSGKFKINGIQTGTFTGVEQLFFIGENNGNDVINASLANLSVTPQGTAAGFGLFGVNIDARAGNDIVLGSAGGDNIDGGSGDDGLYGQGGNDTILGNLGFDIIFGGAGIDTLSGGSLNDFIFGGTENDIH